MTTLFFDKESALSSSYTIFKAVPTIPTHGTRYVIHKGGQQGVISLIDKVVSLYA